MVLLLSQNLRDVRPNLPTKLWPISTVKWLPGNIGMGTIFRLGEQKLNDFSVREAKIGGKTIKTIKFKV